MTSEHGIGPDSKRLKKPGREIRAAAALMILAAGALFLYARLQSKEAEPGPLTVESDVAAEDIAFSLDQYFYGETVELALDVLNDDIVSVFYTLDASPPDSGNGIRYVAPLTLDCPKAKDVATHIVKACGQRADGSYTEVITHTYFTGTGLAERFDTLVFSLSTDPDNLYDYDYGILTTGRIRDEYLAESGVEEADSGAPANYFMRGAESERPVYMEVFDPQGGLLLAQNAGMRVHGGYTRIYKQKSLKLFARSEYDALQNSFEFDFFPFDTTNYGMSITDYKRLVLRNSGNDRGAAYLRDEVVQACAEETGLQDVQHSRPAAVFLNGEYYGFAWIKEVYHDHYLDSQNQINDNTWAILSTGEMAVGIQEEDSPFIVQAKQDHNEMYAYSEKDLTDDRIFAELCELIDIDNFLTYYATEIYINNADWPGGTKAEGGNKKMYRYYGTPFIDDGISTADGKWRWLLYDTDCGLGLGDFGAALNTLGTLLGMVAEENYVLSLSPSPLLISVLRRDDMREKFVGILCDLMNYQFSPERVASVVAETAAARYAELDYQLTNSGGGWEDINIEVEKINTFSQSRPFEIRKQIEACLGIAPTGFTVTCSLHESAGIQINSCKLDRDFEGFYYDFNILTFTATPPIGEVFSYWLVNGEKITEPVLRIGKEYVVNGQIQVELVTAAGTDFAPVITMADYEGSMDCLEISNPYDANLDLRRFYISDDPENPFKQVLADCILRPGERLMLYCDNYTSLDALGGFLIHFNFKNGEHIYLRDNKGTILQEVILPMIKNENIIVMNRNTGTFTDVDRTDFQAQPNPLLSGFRA